MDSMTVLRLEGSGEMPPGPRIGNRATHLVASSSSKARKIMIFEAPKRVKVGRTLHLPCPLASSAIRINTSRSIDLYCRTASSNSRTSGSFLVSSEDLGDDK